MGPTTGASEHGAGAHGTQRQVPVSGQVQLDIGYLAKSGSLNVHLVQCVQLAPVSRRRTTSNPYVKLYLLPDRTKSGKRRSSVKRNELSPKFDERFTFGPIRLADFEWRALWLSVWHKDRLGRNEFLGELVLALAQVRARLASSHLCQSTGAQWYALAGRPGGAPQVGGAAGACRPAAPLGAGGGGARRLEELERKAARLALAAGAPPPPGAAERHHSPPARMCAALGPAPAGSAPAPATPTGQLFLALKFVPETRECAAARRAQGELRVLVKEARQLASQGAQPPSAYCKCYLLDAQGRRLAKHRTGQARRAASPRWDHECAFGPLSLAALAGHALELHVLGRDSILVGARERLGAIRLCASGQLCSERETRLWAQLLARPDIWVYGELPLRQLRPLVPGEPAPS